MEIKYRIVTKDDSDIIELISNWYLEQWNIPKKITIQRLNDFSSDGSQFQVLLTINGIPTATGGLYDHVGLIDKEPRFKIHKNWLALVYTVPDQRHKRIGTLLCCYIERYAKKAGVNEMFLFTDTAERLYARLGWKELERLSLGDRNIVVMKKELQQ
jgi:GNAT superfamily N-acetyltransferase